MVTAGEMGYLLTNGGFHHLEKQKTNKHDKCNEAQSQTETVLHILYISVLSCPTADRKSFTSETSVKPQLQSQYHRVSGLCISDKFKGNSLTSWEMC